MIQNSIELACYFELSKQIDSNELKAMFIMEY